MILPEPWGHLFDVPQSMRRNAMGNRGAGGKPDFSFPLHMVLKFFPLTEFILKPVHTEGWGLYFFKMETKAEKKIN